MKKLIIVLFLSFGMMACGGGGGGGGGGGAEQATPDIDVEEPEASNDSDNNQQETDVTSLSIDPNYNIVSEQITSYSYSSSGADCDLVVYKVPYQKTGVYIEDVSDILEELDSVTNCEITNRKLSVSSTTMELCISKNNAPCLVVEL